MDWRKRNYYLVYTDPLAYQMRHTKKRRSFDSGLDFKTVQS